IVFSGASGTGKSILMNSILSLFGQTDAKSRLSEVSIEDISIKEENYLIESNDDFTIKQSTSSKTRYFLNNQSIPKKSLNKFSKQFFKHLHLKDTSDFDSSNIVEFLDFLTIKKQPKYKNILQNFQDTFKELKEIKLKLSKVIEDEKSIEDLKEFTKFEIEKISSINPQIDEYDELKNLKETMSKKDKIEEILKEAEPFLTNTHKISQALSILDTDSAFFDDAINEVNNTFEKFYDKVANIQDDDIEDTLDRIEKLSFLIKKYGSIEEALEFKKRKEIELESYENISFEKAILEKNLKKLSILIEEQTKELTSYRKKSLDILIKDINGYLKYLYLENLTIELSLKTLNETGNDEITFYLNNTNLSKISSGEFNRLRLALLTARSLYEIDKNGILFLDEIDANLSGKESESIAKVLDVLSKNYQIFAISHQPQLSSTAHQHFLVSKENGISSVKELNQNEKITEISRMISGENITDEATQFAKKLLNF
ncbi:MAG: DNA recombination protein RecN, partial [Arcobacteraceae bacterium]|nr:DNA recombination protein RecN [Arcobacteraceae bacterium]